MTPAAPQPPMAGDDTRPRIAIVVQRYGTDINGGAEMHARLLVQVLKPHYRIDVLTSCARNYHSWQPELPAGTVQEDAGVRVLRLAHGPRLRDRSRYMPLRHKLRYKLRHLLARGGVPWVARPSGHAGRDGERFLRAQGPAMDSLLQYLHQHADDYRALVFLTARFFPTALGVLVAPERSILVPTLHDEKAMYLPHFHRVFRAPRAILYNTRAEQAVAERLYGSDLAPGQVCGVGIDLPPAPARTPQAEAAWAALATRLGLDAPFVMYVGRVDPSKGCDELFRHFARLRAGASQPLKLVVCGRLTMPAPVHPDIVLTGFAEQADRDALLARAAALVLPSRHESLSLVVLESMAAGCPVIVHRHCAVLRDHVADSGAGWTYDGLDGLRAALTACLAQPAAARQAMAAAGRRYVEQHYAWPRIVALLRHTIDAMPAARAGARERPP